MARSTTPGTDGGVRCVITTPESTVLDTRATFVSIPLFDGQRGVGRGAVLNASALTHLFEFQFLRTRVGIRCRQRDRDEDDTDVHDHSAVRAADKAAQPLASGCQHELAQRRAARETSERESKKRGEAVGTHGNADDERSDSTPCRPEQSVAQQLARCLAPRQHRSDAHQREHRDADGSRQPVEERLGDRDLTALQRLDDERKHRAEQHDECKDAEENVVRQECPFARHRRVDCARRTQLVATPSDETQRDNDDQTEEHEQVRTDVAFKIGRAHV